MQELLPLVSCCNEQAKERENNQKSIGGRRNNRKNFQQISVQKFPSFKKECERQRSFTKRYRWIVNGGVIDLKYPSYLTSAELRKWLDETFPDVDPKRPGEAERIQTLLNEHFAPVRHIPLDAPMVEASLDAENGFSFAEMRDSIRFVHNLADAVAKEKVANIGDLRPAIRKLGPDGVKALIKRIFIDIALDQYRDIDIANEIGINKSTFSRFSGSKWSESQSQEVIPDLWQNTAHMLAKSDIFMETVVNSGMIGGLERLIAIMDNQG